MTFSEFIEKRFGVTLYNYQKVFIDKCVENQKSAISPNTQGVKNKIIASGHGGKNISRIILAENYMTKQGGKIDV